MRHGESHQSAVGRGTNARARSRVSHARRRPARTVVQKGSGSSNNTEILPLVGASKTIRIRAPESINQDAPLYRSASGLYQKPRGSGMSSRNILCRPKMPVIFLTLLLVSYCRGRIVHARAPFSTHAVALNVRGGSQGPSSSISYDPSSPYDGQTSAAPQGDFYAPPIVADDENDPFHESVQARVDSWRSQQLERSAELQESLRDDQGRVKLLSTVSRGSRAFIFFMLLFRNIHLFEVADQVFSGFTRLLVVTPLLLLFIGNFAGLVASFTAPSHSAKKRLKASRRSLANVFPSSLVHWNLPFILLSETYIGDSQSRQTS